MEGHEKGVNCVNYCSDGDKSYVVSGGDDNLVKIWDYQVRNIYQFICIFVDTHVFYFKQNKTCIQTLEGHSQNVGCVAFHSELPIILSASEMEQSKYGIQILTLSNQH